MRLVKLGIIVSLLVGGVAHAQDESRRTIQSRPSESESFTTRSNDEDRQIDEMRVYQGENARQALLSDMNIQAEGEGGAPVYRITPRNLYNTHITADLFCYSGPSRVLIEGNYNYWSCEGSVANRNIFYFKNLEPNSTYVATIEHFYYRQARLTVTANGQEQVSSFEWPESPMLVAFQTGNNETTATVKVDDFIGGHINTAVAKFFSLELEKLQ